MRFLRSALVPLALIVGLGALLRFYRLNWDENQHVHPDERYITWVATSIQWPPGLNTWAGWQAAFDPNQSTFNPFYWPPQAGSEQVPQGQPRSFAYGHFPLYLLVAIANALAAITRQPNWLSYDALALVGRAISAIFDLGTVVMTFLIGRRVFGRGVGLLAAALVAFAPLHIQLAHFGAFDTAMVFFMMAALWLTMRYLQTRHLRDGVMAGACAGLAIGSKFTAVWLLALLAMLLTVDAWLVASVRSESVDLRPPIQSMLKLLGPLGAMLAAAFVAFAITNPFALIEAHTFLTEVANQAAMARGKLDWEYVRQYHNTWPYLYPIWQMVQFSLGAALGLASWAGFAWALWRAWRQNVKLDELILLAWTVSYFVLTGGLYVKFVRYMLPIIPALAILGAALLASLKSGRRQDSAGACADQNRKNLKSAFTSVYLRSILSSVLIALTLAATILSGWAFVHVYDGEHPWITASRWIYAHVSQGAVLAVEHWDDRLPLPMDIDGQARKESEYTSRELQPYDDPDSAEKLDGMLAVLAESDYVVLPTHRLWGTIPRWPQRYPLTTRYYQALFGGQLGYQLEFFAARYPHLGPITFMDQPYTDPALPIPLPLRNYKPSPLVIGLGRADESFTVYDHPLVLIFRNVARLSLDQMRRRATSNQ